MKKAFSFPFQWRCAVLGALLFVLVLPLCAQEPVRPSAPPLTDALLRELGVAGVTYEPQDSASWAFANGSTVYSTWFYGAKYRGYMGPTPLFIAVGKKGKITSVVAAPNAETPPYFDLVRKKLLRAWHGKTLSQAATFAPDAVTGATYSSEAVIRNVQATAKARVKP